MGGVEVIGRQPPGSESALDTTFRSTLLSDVTDDV